ncbi:hypothetical protein I7I50_05938 [Histoplasma capsulatum G186AR]|uniref:Uncharacterized protein n=1 Tax=Ajellomyces capsulatus TaxID=5037 RepID=A0A8H7ZB42_AJECA|nr:hypothetical protein I7I52_04197 [Histoplasma capsulatum]QSS76475.1 hypothetical protein I7I50_05938 [Histoplasma capsulatum G186AR]
MYRIWYGNQNHGEKSTLRLTLFDWPLPPSINLLTFIGRFGITSRAIISSTLLIEMAHAVAIRIWPKLWPFSGPRLLNLLCGVSFVRIALTKQVRASMKRPR